MDADPPPQPKHRIWFEGTPRERISLARQVLNKDDLARFACWCLAHVAHLAAEPVTHERATSCTSVVTDHAHARYARTAFKEVAADMFDFDTTRYAIEAKARHEGMNADKSGEHYTYQAAHWLLHNTSPKLV